MDGTDPCSAPLQVLTTPELLQQGHSTLTGASNLVLAVENALTANPGAYSAEHPLTVFGYSQAPLSARSRSPGSPKPAFPASCCTSC